MKYFTFFILFISLFSGCSSVHPPMHEYTILPSYVPKNMNINGTNGTLKLSSTRSIASLTSTQFYYLKEASSINAYLYSKWSDTPSSMIDRSLYSALQNEQLFDTLIPSTSSAAADLVLESDLAAFYHRFNSATSSEGLIDITYRLIDPKTKTTLAFKRFIITQPSPTQDAQGGVVALTDATHILSQQCISWLALTLKESKWTK